MQQPIVQQSIDNFTQQTKYILIFNNKLHFEEWLQAQVNDTLAGMAQQSDAVLGAKVREVAKLFKEII